MSPLASTDEEMTIIRDLFGVLRPDERRAALEILGASLTEPRGPGQCYRCAASIVKKIRGPVVAEIDGT
jgi:hypothetical protein